MTGSILKEKPVRFWRPSAAAARIGVAAALIACLTYNLYRLPQISTAGPGFSDPLLTANYGAAYARAVDGYVGERNWQTYNEIRRHFTDWRLIGFDRDAVLFSSMYAMDYTGPSETAVVSYQPDLTVEESVALTAHVILRRARPSRPTIGVVPPQADNRNRTAVALRSSDGQILIVPIDLAPARFADLTSAR